MPLVVGDEKHARNYCETMETVVSRNVPEVGDIGPTHRGDLTSNYYQPKW